MTQSQELENKIAKSAKWTGWLLVIVGLLLVVDVVILFVESYKLFHS